MFTLLMQRRLRWLGHVHRNADGRMPVDLHGFQSVEQVVDLLNCGKFEINTSFAQNITFATMRYKILIPLTGQEN